MLSFGANLVHIPEQGGLLVKHALLQDSRHQARQRAAALLALRAGACSGLPVRQGGEVLRPDQAHQPADHAPLQQRLGP